MKAQRGRKPLVKEIQGEKTCEASRKRGKKRKIEGGSNGVLVRGVGGEKTSVSLGPRSVFTRGL